METEASTLGTKASSSAEFLNTAASSAPGVVSLLQCYLIGPRQQSSIMFVSLDLSIFICYVQESPKLGVDYCALFTGNNLPII